MSSTQSTKGPATQLPTAATVDLKLEVVVLPVSDVDRAKRFYEGLGWRLDGEAARRELIGRGADVSEPFHFTSIGGAPVPASTQSAART